MHPLESVSSAFVQASVVIGVQSRLIPEEMFVSSLFDKDVMERRASISSFIERWWKKEELVDTRGASLLIASARCRTCGCHNRCISTKEAVAWPCREKLDQLFITLLSKRYQISFGRSCDRSIPYQYQYTIEVCYWSEPTFSWICKIASASDPY